MIVSDNRWIKEAWKQETMEESNSIKDEIILTMQTKGEAVEFEEDIKLERKILDKEFKPMNKNTSKKVARKKRFSSKKEMQREIHKKQDKECNIWLEQKLKPRKTSVIMLTIEKMIETRAW